MKYMGRINRRFYGLCPPREVGVIRDASHRSFCRVPMSLFDTNFRFCHCCTRGPLVSVLLRDKAWPTYFSHLPRRHGGLHSKGHAGSVRAPRRHGELAMGAFRGGDGRRGGSLTTLIYQRLAVIQEPFNETVSANWRGVQCVR